MKPDGVIVKKVCRKGEREAREAGEAALTCLTALLAKVR